jgi:protein-disulfide isomerase
MSFSRFGILAATVALGVLTYAAPVSFAPAFADDTILPDEIVPPTPVHKAKPAAAATTAQPVPAAKTASAAPAAPGGAITVSLPASVLDDAIQDYLKRHPEAVMEALQASQAKQQGQQTADAEKAIVANKKDIYDDKNSPVAGNPKGKQTLVEFFDYSCHYCKQIHPDLQTLLSEDHDLKVIYKDFPILGPQGMLGAKAALAAKMQGKYVEMHNALFDYKDGPIDDAAIQKISAQIGVNYDKLKTDMDKPEIAQEIADNNKLAQALNIHGTPSLIINGQFFGGALPLDVLKQKVQDTSKAG